MLLTSNSHGGSTSNLGKESGELHRPVLYMTYERSFQRMIGSSFPFEEVEVS